MNKERKLVSNVVVLKTNGQRNFILLENYFTRKPLCEICNTNVVVVKQCSPQRHFNKIHGNTTFSLLEYGRKQRKVQELTNTHKSQQNNFKKICNLKAATETSYFVA